MKVTDEVRITTNLLEYSYSGKCFAYASQNTLYIKSSSNFHNVASFVCSDIIEKIEWSPDSLYVLCAIYKRSSIEVFSIHNDSWICKIQEGTGGLQSCCWSPLGAHILTVSDFNVKLSIWSLINRTVSYIHHPLLNKEDCFSFDNTGNLFAVITSREDTNYIQIFSTIAWQLKQEIKINDKIIVPSNPIWSPDSQQFAIYDTLETRYYVLQIHNLYTNKTKLIISTARRTGVNLLKWSSNGQFLAVGCYNNCIYLLNYITGACLFELCHNDVINTDCIVHREECISEDSSEITLQQIHERPLVISSIKSQIDLESSIKFIEFSSCGNFIVTNCTNTPAVAWIWAVNNFELTHVIILQNEICSFSWSHTNCNLLISYNSCGIVHWCGNCIMYIPVSTYDCILKTVFRPCEEKIKCIALSDSAAYVLSE